QVEQLREAVEYHDYRYYVENDPIISDNAYDQLFDRLQTLEDEFDLHSETSPTQRVGGETLDELETREHVQEMLSLASSGDEEEVRDFASTVNDEVGDVEYSVEPKFDGFSVEIVYLNGSFDRAVTRGDGIEGEDVSENVKTIPTVPLELQNAPDFLAVLSDY
ncbi:MAG: NAD-dependent DNA ligase LigA, partial [Halobacteriaceae archaeon]